MPLCANGHGVPVTAAYCSICGAAMNAPTGPAPTLPPPAYPPMGYVPRATGNNTMGLSALICGIVSLIVCWPLGILAVVFGIIGLNKCSRGEATNPGQAKWGIGLGIAGTVIGLSLANWVLNNYDTSQPLF